MSAPSVLYDAAGPRARRRNAIGSAAGGLVLLVALVLLALRLGANGQFEADKWSPFLEEPALYTLLWKGVLYTLQAAAYGLVLAVALGVLLAVGRLSHRRAVRVPCVGIVEFFRAVPLLLLIFFFYLGFPLAFGMDLPPLWALVLGLTLYNGAVIGEIVRAGVLSLPRGQTEAAYAIGLRSSQAMRLVLLPQAIRLMLPALVSQLVVLLKDTSLGFIVSYEDLLANGEAAARQLGNPIQIFAFVALVYILINSALSWLAGYLERRMSRQYGRAAVARAEAVVDEAA
ncbi:MAG: amino acid ABC transporter permease [Streptomycetales bacterium]